MRSDKYKDIEASGQVHEVDTSQVESAEDIKTANKTKKDKKKR